MTPTREQVKQWALDAGCVSAEFWPDDFSGLMATFERFAAITISAGRDQGLREAKEVCEGEKLEGPSNEARFYNKACDECAAAIEQLRGK